MATWRLTCMQSFFASAGCAAPAAVVSATAAAPTNSRRERIAMEVSMGREPWERRTSGWTLDAGADGTGAKPFARGERSRMAESTL